jgi:hypothetical protein
LYRHTPRFRQVHLDFHTSEHIPGVGAEFSTKQWQEALIAGHVNSITCFSKCHHGWSYHPTSVGRMHPALDFDLLRAQIDACKEIGVAVPIYLSAGIDELMASEHPEWQEVTVEGKYYGWVDGIDKPGYTHMCFQSPYTDYLCEQIREAVTLFPDCAGVFLDIVCQGQCCCKWCLAYMEENGLDAAKPEDRKTCSEAAIRRYFREATAAARGVSPQIPIYHNNLHILSGVRDVQPYYSHIELESLPSFGLGGYDSFRMNARYCRNLGFDIVGMTGKFHTVWAEFGGYKHPNALRYECAVMLAFGAKCSVGDQLHPSGRMDPTTYKLIGQAYAEVERKEPWCDGVVPVSDIAVLKSESENGDRSPDVGANRSLLESHFLFDFVDRDMDFAGRKVLILPDTISVDDGLLAKIEAFLASGGKLLLTGASGLRPDGSGFALDVGAEHCGTSEYQPDYLVAGDRLAPYFIESPLVMYLRSQRVLPTTGEVLARIRYPYFNRTWRHFCSHQHTPDGVDSPYAAAVRKGPVLYLAHPVFSIYHAVGASAYREYIANAVRELLGSEQTVVTDLPSAGIVTLNEQPDKKRYVLHVAYGSPIARGASVSLSPEGYVKDSAVIEMIEDLIPVRNVNVSLRLSRKVRSVTLEPQGVRLPFVVEDGTLSLTIDEVDCHQMVVLDFE